MKKFISIMLVVIVAVTLIPNSISLNTAAPLSSHAHLVATKEQRTELCLDCSTEKLWRVARFTAYCPEARQWLVLERRAAKRSSDGQFFDVACINSNQWTVTPVVDMSRMPTIIGRIVSFEERNVILMDSFIQFITREVLNGVNLSDFTFERGNHNGGGFHVFYKGVLLNDDSYFFYINISGDSVNVFGGIWESRDFEKAHDLELEPAISLEEAIQIAREHSDGLEIICRNNIDNWAVGNFVPKRPEAELIIYCLEEQIVVYKVTDENYYYDIADFVGYPSEPAWYVDRALFTIFINAVTGEVLDHSFNVDIAYGGG
jgi:hypothetical protein